MDCLFVCDGNGRVYNITFFGDEIWFSNSGAIEMKSDMVSKLSSGITGFQ